MATVLFGTEKTEFNHLESGVPLQYLKSPSIHNPSVFRSDKTVVSSNSDFFSEAFTTLICSFFIQY